MKPETVRRLRALRTRRGWSRTELARRLGVARLGTIEGLERGTYAPGPALARKIRLFFDREGARDRRRRRRDLARDEREARG